ncbi:amino acid ABC transporter permease [Azospirillum sp. ST 5-10]|uniref:amino acid ABC transporter permease n=1 Tax=unclassified Azospirillum TaxID=2630922 RepID=UPI003F49DAF2
MTISLSLILDYLVSPVFFNGAVTTLLITVSSILSGVVIGLLLALLQESRFAVVRGGTTLYLWLFRGTPVLFQIIFVFNVLPSFGIILSGFVSGVLALSLNEGAYMAEIMRSGLQAVKRGQKVAGRALGMTEWQVMRFVVLPQALRVILPPIGNQLIGMMKLSALVSAIAVQDLLLAANQTASADFRYFEALTAAGIYYLAMTTVFMVLQSALERRLAARRRPGGQKLSLTRRLIGATGAQSALR